MDISKVSSQILTERLDAEFYRPSFLENAARLDKLEHCIKLGQAADKIKLGYTGPTEKYYSSQGAFYLSSKNIVDGIIVLDEQTDRISFEAHRGALNSTSIKFGDLLISRTGCVGKCAILYDLANHYNIAAHLIAIRLNQELLDREYVAVFFNSRFGQLQSQRLQRGTIIQGLSVYDLPELLIPKFTPKVQAYIGDKVRQAERLRERSQKAGLELRDKMQKCFRGKPKPPQNRFSNVPSNKLTGNRLESEFYTPLVLWADEEIKGTPWKYQPLSELTHRIKDGPGGWGVSTGDYVTYGIPVIRAVNLMDGECDLSDCVFISPKKHKELIRHRAAKGSVLVSVRGTIGRAAVFESEDFEEASLNAAVVTIDCKDEILPHYLAEFLNTEIGKIQSNRIANGAVQLNMNLTETGSNLIVVAPKDFQEEISTLRQQRLLFKALSHKLTVAAKLLVEALIEGKLSEADLKAAQEGLEQGDTTLDRAILARLTRKGIDCSNEPPLFPDLDALYTALANLEANEDIDTADSGNGKTANVYSLPHPSIPLASETSPDAYASTEEVSV